MATHYISPESPSWGGSPRKNSNQYIQDAIDSGSAGDTYVLESGKHEGQEFDTNNGDEIVLEEGAVLTGAEDLTDYSWTNEGSGVWSCSVDSNEITSAGGVNPASGYDAENLNAVVVDTRLIAFYTSNSPDADGCYYDGTDLYVAYDPTSYTIEMCREEYGISGGATLIRGESADERALIYGYATDNGGLGGSCLNADGNGSGCVHRDLDVRSCAGGNIGAKNYNEYYNVTIKWAGQLGVYCNDADYTDGVIVGEGCIIDSNAWGAWDNNHEGGNCKWADSVNLTVEGTLWDMGDVDYANLSPFWFDINNDGHIVRSNVVKDRNRVGDRGLMFEISYSGKIYNNILYELGWGQSAEWFFGAIHMDGVGADPPNTEFDDIDIYGNLAYNCSGGIGGCMNRGDSVDDHNKYAPWYNRYWNIHDNTIYTNGDSGQDFWSGYMLPPNSYSQTEVGHDFDWEDNIYLVASADNDFHYGYDEYGSSTTELSWSQWNSNKGFDTGDRAAYVVGSDYDPDPFNGGAM